MINLLGNTVMEAVHSARRRLTRGRWNCSIEILISRVPKSKQYERVFIICFSGIENEIRIQVSKLPEITKQRGI